MIHAELTGAWLRGVTQTIRRMGRGPDAEEKRAPDYLATMNTPALAGQRDAAYLRAVELFRQPVFALPEAERIRLYEGMMLCLGDAVTAGERISSSELSEEVPLLDCLRHLRGDVQVMLLLLRHEQELFAQEKSLTQWLGAEFIPCLRNAEEAVNNAEVGIYHSLQDLVELVEKPWSRLREQTRNVFSRNEVERYDRAFSEFQGHYRARTRLDSGEAGPAGD